MNIGLPFFDLYMNTTSYQTKQKHYYKDLLTIGIPIIIGQLGTIVLGFADTLMIGHHSTQELAAAGLVNNIFGLVLLFYLGFSYGLTPIVGRLFGMGHQHEIGQKVKNSFVANMLIGLLLVFLMTILYFNLGRIGQPKELLGLIRPYFMVNLISVLFVGLFNTLKQFFDGIGDTRVPMWAMVCGNLFNILFNWLLIYGIAFFPEMGLLGAGLSTLGSRILMALALVVVILLRRNYKNFRKDILSGKLNRDDLKEMNRLGWPIALQLGMETAAFSLSCVMVGWLGTIMLAAHQVMITISQLFYLVLSGLASAMSIRISHFVGQKDWIAVRTNANDGFKLVLGIAAVMSVPVVIFRHYIGGIFSTDIEVQQTVALLIIVLIVYQAGDGLQYTFANALRGIACVKPMVTYAFIAYFVISLPLGYALGFVFHFGILGIWCAFPIALSVAGVLYWARFRKELRNMEDK